MAKDRIESTPFLDRAKGCRNAGDVALAAKPRKLLYTLQAPFLGTRVVEVGTRTKIVGTRLSEAGTRPFLGGTRRT